LLPVYHCVAFLLCLILLCLYTYFVLVGWGTTLQAGRSQVRLPMRSLDFSTDPNLPAAQRPWGLLCL
jgi:hypothetical protein